MHGRLPGWERNCIHHSVDILYSTEIFHGRKISPKPALVYCIKISPNFIFTNAVKVVMSTM